MPSTITPAEALVYEINNRVTIARLKASYSLRLLSLANRMSTTMQTLIKWPVDVGGGAAAIEAVTADGAATATDVTKTAILNIGGYRIKHQFSVSTIDMAEAAAIAPEELQNLFASHIDRGIDHIMRRLNTLLFTGDGTAGSGEVVGLQTIGDPTATYAGIVPGTYTAWTPISKLNAGTPRALTRDLLYQIDEETRNRETDYNAIITSPRIGTKYKNLFDTTRPLEFLYGGEDLPKADVGLSTMSYNGKPIITDPQCPAGVMYFVDLGDISIKTFKVKLDPKPTMGTHTSARDLGVANLMGLNVNVAELPSNNSASRRFEMYVLPQVCMENRKSLAVLGDLLTT